MCTLSLFSVSQRLAAVWMVPCSSIRLLADIPDHTEPLSALPFRCYLFKLHFPGSWACLVLRREHTLEGNGGSPKSEERERQAHCSGLLLRQGLWNRLVLLPGSIFSTVPISTWHNVLTFFSVVLGFLQLLISRSAYFHFLFLPTPILVTVNLSELSKTQTACCSTHAHRFTTPDLYNYFLVLNSFSWNT